MPRLICPSCHGTTDESSLLPHPPGAADASRALSKRYCPACGAEVRLVAHLRAWHVLLVAVPFVVVYFKHDLPAAGWPAWIYPAILIMFPGGLAWSAMRARRQVLVAPPSR